MKKERIFFGILFLMLFFAGVYVMVREGYPTYLIWFSNHWALILGIAALSGSAFWIHAELNIALFAEAAWIIDFIGKYFFDGYIFGSTAYMFTPGYPLSMYVGGLFHLVVLPLAFILYWRWGSEEFAWAGSFMHGGILLMVSAFLPGNLNCVREPCTNFLEYLPDYAWMYPVLMLLMIILTHRILRDMRNKD